MGVLNNENYMVQIPKIHHIADKADYKYTFGRVV